MYVCILLTLTALTVPSPHTCMLTYIPTYKHTYIHTYIHNSRARTFPYIHTYLQAHTRTCIHTWFTRTYLHSLFSTLTVRGLLPNPYTYFYIQIHIHTYMNTYIYILPSTLTVRGLLPNPKNLLLHTHTDTHINEHIHLYPTPHSDHPQPQCPYPPNHSAVSQEQGRQLHRPPAHHDRCVHLSKKRSSMLTQKPAFLLLFHTKRLIAAVACRQI